MKKIISLGLLLLVIPFIFSCASVPKEEKVPKDMEVIDMIQKAQESFEINNYRGAKKWYEIILYRFGDSLPVRVEAEYEIAHILAKKRKWKDAYLLLRTLIDRYEAKDGMRLPPEFYKLAKMDYEKVVKHLSVKYIEEEENRIMKDKEGAFSTLQEDEESNIQLETIKDEDVVEDRILKE